MSPQDLLRARQTDGMPDIASDTAARLTGALDRVGMSEIEVPVRLRDETGQLMMLPAKAKTFVSLDDPDARGIHMSRLFLSLQAILGEEELSIATIRRLLQAFVGSHHGISKSSAVQLKFELPLRRPSLISANTAWRSYPVEISGESIDGVMHVRMGVQVAYSSTCPCSAALARQLIQEQFRSDFKHKAAVATDDVVTWLGLESSIMATPHSQRSYAHLQVELAPGSDDVHFIDLIEMLEGALKTPVQAAVKREDEQEFARLNGQNLMFCEDAGRRLKHVLEADARMADWRVEATHVESLHPHDAVSVVVKGVPGGYRP